MKKLLLCIFLLTTPFASAMEGQQEESMQEVHLEELGLPNETWAKVLEHVYIDPTILDQANTIYEAIEIINQYLNDCHMQLSHVCTAFKAINISQNHWIQFKFEIRKLYIPYLNERFLERREGKEGLYPKNGNWCTHTRTNNDIAIFISTGNLLNNWLLINQINTTPINENLINLLLFYGIEPKTKNKAGKSLLNNIKSCPSKVIFFLLRYGTIFDFNIKLMDETSPLYSAVRNYPTGAQYLMAITKGMLEHGANPNIAIPGTSILILIIAHSKIPNDIRPELIKIMLQYGTNPYIKSKKGKTIFELANKFNVKDFSELVSDYFQDSKS